MSYDLAYNTMVQQLYSDLWNIKEYKEYDRHTKSSI